MKTLISLILTVSSSLAFAGGSGGGGVMMDTMRVKHDMLNTNGGGVLSPKEIVFHMGQNNGLVKFAYGQLVDKKWQVQKIEISEADLKVDACVMKALQDSKDLKSWAEIK